MKRIIITCILILTAGLCLAPVLYLLSPVHYPSRSQLRSSNSTNTAITNASITDAAAILSTESVWNQLLNRRQQIKRKMYNINIERRIS